MTISRPLYGIIGGMGPSASSEFVNYIYKLVEGKHATERDYPRIILTSDALAPDRKQSLKNDKFSRLAEFLDESIEKLQAFQPMKIMICCLVAHQCIDSLKSTAKHKIISIIDLVTHQLRSDNEKNLLLASPMMYELNLISAENLILPDKSDIMKIDTLIQRLKLTGGDNIVEAYMELLSDLSAKYKAKAFTLACSDLHLANKSLMNHKIHSPYKVLDSLDIAARAIVNDIGGAQL